MAHESASENNITSSQTPPLSSLSVIEPHKFTPESEVVREILNTSLYPEGDLQQIQTRAKTLIEGIRNSKPSPLSVEGFFNMYKLNSKEGMALMTLAEVLLRVPDKGTKLNLVRDKLNPVDWSSLNTEALNPSNAFIGFCLKWGLITTDFILSLGDGGSNLLKTLSSPAIIAALDQGMSLLGNQFVMGQTIEAAFKNALKDTDYVHSFDMLGEAALTQQDADRYYQSYEQAIIALGNAQPQDKPLEEKSSISIKLSALHPRYEYAQRERVLNELTPKVLKLLELSKTHNIALTIDAEEADRLLLSLEIIDACLKSPLLQGWNGFGLAVQAYQKRAPHVLNWLIESGRTQGVKICVRLVKGAYWDSEIKRAQEKSLDDYPVFTRKSTTDLSYLHCAKIMLDAQDVIYPQFATHNAFTISAIESMAQGRVFEYQRLHGMGESLYSQLKKDHRVRVYAPVGSHRDLLAYLVRRLLENGANASFVNRVFDPNIDLDTLVEDSVTLTKSLEAIPHPKVPNPRDILHPLRRNSKGLDLTHGPQVKAIQECKTPKIGEPHLHQSEDLLKSWDRAQGAFLSWSKTTPQERSQIIHKLGDLLEQNTLPLMKILTEEGGKTQGDAIAEVREAIDFCWYYSAQALPIMTTPTPLNGPTGEKNELWYAPRGTFVCISPWNFPLAIFLGQVTAALVTGNTVVAKPAHQTLKIAQFAVQLAHSAGIPKDVLQLIPTSGRLLSETLLTKTDLAGVAFTGSTETAWSINQTLAARRGPIVPLIAETGGINAMIVDSSALFEQVVTDVVISAFQSAGQRCSALRLLIVQEDIADPLLEMLKGAMKELTLGDPHLLSTDIGPVIDEEAQKELLAYSQELETRATLIFKCEAPLRGNFVPPQAFEVDSIQDVDREVFGPILHVVRYKGGDLTKVIDQINGLGFGLTCGLHSRLESTIETVRNEIHCGNLYINRSMIGAMVGVQPFGGEGLSGTGPKAGGPNYLHRFVFERAFSHNVTASGGNATLLAEVD